MLWWKPTKARSRASLSSEATWGPSDEPPTTIDIGGRIYDLLSLDTLSRARLTHQLKLAQASYVYWVYRKPVSPPNRGDAA